MYMWQMSSVFSHESAQRNDAGHLIDKNVFKNDRVVLKTFLSLSLYIYDHPNVAITMSTDTEGCCHDANLVINGVTGG